MILFDGKQHSEVLENRIKDVIDNNPTLLKNILLVISIGKNEESKKYISLKKKTCDKFGIVFHHLELDENLSDELLAQMIHESLKDPAVASVIIQLPLPRPSLYALLNDIPVEKDIDVLSDIARTLYYSNTQTMLSPVIRSVDYFTKHIDFKFESSYVVCIGDGSLVGKPVAHYFKSRGSNVSVYNETHDIASKHIKSDLLILGAGVPNLIAGQNVSPHTSVIDFGSSLIGEKTVGDLNMHSSLNHLNFVCPSPGGMGPLVVRFLILNHLRVY